MNAMLKKHSRAHKQHMSLELGATKINGASFTFWVCLLLYFSHWVGVQLSAVVFLGLLYVAILSRLHIGKVRRELLFVSYFICSYSLLVILIQTPSLDEFYAWSPTQTPRLLFQAISMFLVFVFMNLLKPLTQKRWHQFIRYSYNIFVITIVAEWVLVNVLGVPNSLMPGFRDSHSYSMAYESYYRPFGLTGNSSVNGALLVTALWMLLLSGTTKFVGRYIVLTGFVLFLNNSGQAYLVYFLSLIYYCFSVTKGVKRVILALMFVFLMGYILFSGVISKFSYEYILTMLQFIGLDSIMAMDQLSRILGGYSKYSWVYENSRFLTEFYPVYAISRFGFFLFLMTWVYIFWQLPKKNRGLMFLVLFFGSIHYPTILFVETQVLLGAYLFLAPPIIPKVPISNPPLLFS